MAAAAASSQYVVHTPDCVQLVDANSGASVAVAGEVEQVVWALDGQKLAVICKDCVNVHGG